MNEKRNFSNEIIKFSAKIVMSTQYLAENFVQFFNLDMQQN
jgi:hypothetical protein